MSVSSDSDSVVEPLSHSRPQRNRRRRRFHKRSWPSDVRFTLKWGSDSDSSDSEPLPKESGTGKSNSTAFPSLPLLNMEQNLDEACTSLRSGGPSYSAPALLPNQSPPTAHPEEALIPRRYQLEILRQAKETNIIAVLETGAGKTLVAALLVKETLRSLNNPEMVDKTNLSFSLLPHVSPSYGVVSPRIVSAVEPNVDASHEAISSLHTTQNADPDPSLGSDFQQNMSELLSSSNESMESAAMDNDILEATQVQRVEPSNCSVSSGVAPHLLEENRPGFIAPLANGSNVMGPPYDATDLSSSISEPSVKNNPNSISALFHRNKNTALRKQIVFLVHRVALVPQQAKVLRSVIPPEHRVALFYGEKSGDEWSSSEWIFKLRSKTVLVMTAQILLNLLRHGILDMQNLALLILDEVHHATGNHPYSRIFVEFYHTIPQGRPRPRVFGMTATPVKRKAQAKSEEHCLHGICALEATLDANIVTVSDDHHEEFHEHVPKPEELVLQYKGTQDNEEVYEFSDYDLESRVLSKFENDSSSDTCGVRDVKDSGSDEGKPKPCDIENGDCALQADEMKVIHHICRKLGLMAAHGFAVRLCKASGVDQQKVMDELLPECIPTQIETGGMPEKVSKLLDLLCSEWLRYEEDAKASHAAADGFRCIVFIHERSCALALAWLINEVFQHMNTKALQASSVVGCQSNESIVRMSRSKLLRTVNEFRNGGFGVLVATNVVEEGLNVPTCRLVVSFDDIKSPTAYVQARGRARRKNSKYVVFLDENDKKCSQAFLDARRGATLMSQVSKRNRLSKKEKESIRASFLADNIVEEDVLYSRTTNAKVDPTQAVCLLEKYCNMKASQWNVDNARPKYQATEVSTGILATVKINEKSGIDGGCCNEPKKNELLARRYAALDAYKKLYEIGEVDAYLLPRRPPRSLRVLRSPGLKSDKRLRIQPVKGHRRRCREVQSKASKKDKRVRRCNILHPSVLQLEASENVQKIQTLDEKENAAAKSVQADPVQRSTLTLNMRVDKVPRKFLMYIVKLDCDMSKMAWYEEYKEEHYALLVREQLLDEDLTAVRCPTGQSMFTLKYHKEIEWSADLHTRAQKYVLFLQLCLWGRTPGSSRALEVEVGEKVKGSIAGFLLMPLKKDAANHYDVDWKSVDHAISLTWKKKRNEEGNTASPHHYEHALVCSSHENFDRVYLSGCVDDSIRADSSVEGYLNPNTFKSFVDYYRLRHKLVIKDSKQPMLPGASVRSTMNQLSLSFFMLPIETCALIPISPQACFITGMLPAWQTFLAIRNCWRKNSVKACPAEFLSFAKALQPNISYVTKGVADLSYERLEFLGDAVLKVLFSMVAFVGNPEESEGILSDIRDIEVSNQRLADLAIQMKLHDCVAFSGVSQNVKSWPWFWASQSGDQIRISEKVLADCVEALLGVQYLYGGLELVTAFVDKHNLMPGACRVLGYTTTSHVNTLVLPVPPMASGDDRYESDALKEIEDILGYKFRDRRHLVIALTHGSFENGHITSYQRYEYLGDAIIGFLLLSHFFNEYPNFSPGELTSLRGPALSNDLFARVIVSKGIHRKFWYDCLPLKKEIERFVNLVANEEDDEEDVCKTMTVPKVLGDLLESIIGAIVVDKGMRFDGVQDIVLRLMEDELNRFANPSKFRRNPISELVCIVQKRFRTKGPRYEYLDESNDMQKICVVSVENQELGKGFGPTRRIARRHASIVALNKLLESTVEDLEKGDQQIEDCSNDEDMIPSSENI